MVYISDFAGMTHIIQVHMTSTIHGYGNMTDKYKSRFNSFHKLTYIHTTYGKMMINMCNKEWQVINFNNTINDNNHLF